MIKDDMGVILSIIIGAAGARASRSAEPAPRGRRWPGPCHADHDMTGLLPRSSAAGRFA